MALSQVLKKAGEEKTHKGMFDKMKEEDLETMKSASESPMNIPPIPEWTKTQTVAEQTQINAEEIQNNNILVGIVNATDADSLLDDRSIDEIKEEEQNDDLYNIKNFSI